MVDRQKIRQYEIRKEREARQQAEADEMAGRAVNLAAEGNDAETICRILDEDKIPYSRDYIEKLVGDAQTRAEAGGEQDEETEELLEMSKVSHKHLALFSNMQGHSSTSGTHTWRPRIKVVAKLCIA